MSKIFLPLILILCGIVFACEAMGMDCDITSPCCSMLVCADYRCQMEGAEDNKVKWSPDGPKCDFFNPCEDGYACKSHRCYLQITKNTKLYTSKNATDTDSQKVKKSTKLKNTNKEKPSNGTEITKDEIYISELDKLIRKLKVIRDQEE